MCYVTFTFTSDKKKKSNFIHSNIKMMLNNRKQHIKAYGSYILAEFRYFSVILFKFIYVLLVLLLRFLFDSIRLLLRPSLESDQIL